LISVWLLCRFSQNKQKRIKMNTISSNSKVHEYKELIGKTFVSVENIYNEELVFTDSNGGRFKFYHAQDGWEYVVIHDIIGDLNDLVGYPLLLAEEVIREGPEEPDKCFTWTFYKFATIKGYVTVRWYGESNGHYSEKVDFAVC